MEASFFSPFNDVFTNGLGFAWVLVIICAPIILAWFFFESFVTLRRQQFIHAQEKVVLEIKLPRIFPKSPLAMELFLTSLYQTKGEGTWINRYLYGKVRPWFSLELISDGGNIRFYIWCWKFWKHLVVSQLYAQFPDIEIKEVEDYTSKVHFNHHNMDLWGCNFKLSKASHYPILTYEKYKLDKDPDEELKVDPMTPILEYLGSLREGEQAWIQILIRAHKKEQTKPGTWFEKVDWTYAANEEIKKLKGQDTSAIGDVKLEGFSLSKGDREIIDAIQHNISKIPFDVGIRALYFAPLDKFNEINVAGLNGAFRQYNSANLNSFEADHATSFDYPWQDFTGKRLLGRKEHTIHAYGEREFFHKPNPGHFFTMSTEGLATIYHFPGEVAKTPTIGRIEAKKSEPPANLPI